MFRSVVVLAVVAVLALCSPAPADVIFGFDVNTANPTQMFGYTPGSPAMLTAASVLDLTVNIDGHIKTFPDAAFQLSGTLSSVTITSLGIGFSFDGSFTFNGTSGLIVQGDFANAQMFLLNGSSAASLVSSSRQPGTPVGMHYTAGPEFAAYMVSLGLAQPNDPITFAPLEDMAFTLTNITPPTPQGFTANGSFSGNTVPEPATLSLLVLGGLALIRRRK